MRKNYISILSIILLSSILRFYKLGIVPEALSLDEVRVGLLLSKFSNLFFDPVFLRIPFAILGVLSVYLFYLICKKYFNIGFVPLISTLLVSILPWHIQESRIFSKTMFIFVAIQTLILLAPKELFTNIKNRKIFILFTFVGILISILIPSKGVVDYVNNERHLISQNSPKILSKIFVNKIVYNYKLKEKRIFENLDIGTYFFSGHPRERWGVEESQKIYLFLLPLVIFGIVKIKSNEKTFLFNYFVFSILIFVFVNFSNLILILPMVVLASYGLQNYKNSTRFRLMAVFCFVLAVYEIVNFNKVYFLNMNKSLFSPRRTVFKYIVETINKNKLASSFVLVNDKIGDSEEYFKYYLRNNTQGYEFRSFNILKEAVDKNKIYIDTIPQEAGPSEPLYTKDGSWPTIINVLAEFEDYEKRSIVVIYKIK